MNKVKKIFSKILSCLCTLILVLSVVAAVSSLFLKNSGKIRFLGKYAVVRILTQSMEPAIGAKDYILLEKVGFSELQVGDIITFYSDDPSIAGELNTHRIVAFAEDGSAVTKGDYNLKEDDFTVSAEKVAGRYVKTLGFLTGIFNIFSKPVGYVALIVLPLLLMTSLSFKEVLAATKKPKDGEETKKNNDVVRTELEKMKQSGELERRLSELTPPAAKGEKREETDEEKKKSE